MDYKDSFSSPFWAMPENTCARAKGKLRFPQCFPQRIGSSPQRAKVSGRGRKLVKTEVLRGVSAKLPDRKTQHAAQIARGPRRRQIGSMKTALKRPRSPRTAIPTRRTGTVRSHTMGYSTRASSASGQQSTHRMIHKKKAAMITSLVAGTRKNQQP